eukprot:5101851-Pleurochrysis_carterae.AAC.2
MSRTSEKSAAALASSSAFACWIEKGWSSGGTGTARRLSHRRGARGKCRPPLRGCAVAAWRAGVGCDKGILSDVRHFLQAGGIHGLYHRSPTWLAGRRACSGVRCGRRSRGWCDPDPDPGGPPSACNPPLWRHSAYRPVVR